MERRSVYRYIRRPINCLAMDHDYSPWLAENRAFQRNVPDKRAQRSAPFVYAVIGFSDSPSLTKVHLRHVRIRFCRKKEEEEEDTNEMKELNNWKLLFRISSYSTAIEFNFPRMGTDDGCSETLPHDTSGLREEKSDISLLLLFRISRSMLLDVRYYVEKRSARQGE